MGLPHRPARGRAPGRVRLQHRVAVLSAWPLLLLACGQAPQPPQTAPPRPSFLVIDIDSWRADRLAARRDGRPIAPALSALASRGVRFTQAFSQSAWTMPAVYSLLTGRYPLLVEVQENTLPQRDPAVRHLPEILGLYDYRSIVFWGQTIISGNEQLSAGFTHQAGVSGQGYGLPLEHWLAEAPGQPFFAFVHNLDLHAPSPAMPAEALHRFVPPVEGCPGGAPDEALAALVPLVGEAAAREHVIGHYDGELSLYDEAVGDLLGQLQRAGVAEQTVVIVTSDHGEELFERGSLRHGVHSDTVLRVPLVIAEPGATPAVVDSVVQTVDLLPTILDLAQVPPPAVLDGQSLVPLLRGTDGYQARDVLSISNRENASLRTATYKTIVRSDWDQPDSAALVRERYDLVGDPQEQQPLADHDSPEAQAAFARLDAWRQERMELTGQLPRAPLSEEQEQKLRDQGYWGLANPEGDGRTKPVLETAPGAPQARPQEGFKPPLEGDPPLPEPR